MSMLGTAPSIAALVSLLAAGDTLAQDVRRVAPSKLKDYKGQTVMVCGQVVTHACSDKDYATTLDLERPYWSNGAAVLITEAARRSFPPRLEDRYALADICATGVVERRERRHVIRVETPEQIEVTLAPPPVLFLSDAVRPCDVRVELPELTHEVKARYTWEAMRARIGGVAFLEAEVFPDGTVGETRVLHGFHPSHGLLDEAIHAVRQWRFKPAMSSGKAVPMIVPVEISFRPK